MKYLVTLYFEALNEFFHYAIASCNPNLIDLYIFLESFFDIPLFSENCANYPESSKVEVLFHPFCTNDDIVNIWKILFALQF